MAFSWMSAVVLIVVIAVAAFLRTFESNAQRLTYVNSFVNSSVNLMEYKFVWLGVGEALCRIGYYFGVVVGIDFIVCVREAYARVFAPANAVIEMETAVPEVEVLTAPVATAPPPRANAGVAPNTAPPPALTEQAAVDPIMDANEQAAVDVIEDIEVLPLRSPRGPVVTAQLGFATGNNLAGPAPETSTASIMETMRCVMVQQNARNADREAREAENQRRLDAAAAQQR